MMELVFLIWYYSVQDEEVVLERVSGYRDYANELPNTIDTKFASASAGKVFVAVGILQLIEKGKIQKSCSMLYATIF